MSAPADLASAIAETAVLRTVIEQLLCVRDLDQLLLSISDRTLHLLDADICGVLLREGDVLRMRSCVGHRVVETSRLRMERGQGVAGLVFLTGEPAERVAAVAREERIHFIAAGHHATETFGVRRLGDLLAERHGIVHRFIDVPNPI